MRKHYADRHHNEKWMPSIPADPQLAREAKAIVALAFRNGPIEKVHAGKLCPTCGAGAEYSRITDGEMEAIMRSAVDRVYTLLRLKNADLDGYERQIAFGARYAAKWDEPEDSTQGPSQG